MTTTTRERTHGPANLTAKQLRDLTPGWRSTLLWWQDRLVLMASPRSGSRVTVTDVQTNECWTVTGAEARKGQKCGYCGGSLNYWEDDPAKRTKRQCRCEDFRGRCVTEYRDGQPVALDGRWLDGERVA